MASVERNALVSTDWLAKHLNAPDIRVIDATDTFPTLNRIPCAEYEEAHIPGAIFFDIDDIADETSELPHMVPDAAKFSSRVRKLGLGDGVRIVCYDSNRFSASARAWWMFRMFGHDDVVVLNGGLGKWRADGHPVDDHPVTPSERHFTARQNNLLLRELDQIRAHVINPGEQLIDARSSGRFLAQEAEPRPGQRAGHIPHSLNVPYTDLLAPDGTLLPTSKLQTRFAEAGVDPRQPIATTCGSGVTACTLALALYQLGVPDVAVYDGSWTEWGGRSDTPIET
ncbi:MAG: 3-mercaptopyruvate sulfurtransferase [Geminicoccaceae bacterium]